MSRKSSASHQQHREGITSTAHIGGHPIHPMLIPFPIALLVGALLTDLAYWQTGDAFWARGSLWLLAAGVVTGLLAGAVGAIDFFTIERAREHTAGRIHAVGNIVAVVLSLVNLLLRWGDPEAGVMPWGLLLSVLVAAILTITGWYGGELVFRHKIGVTGHREP